MDIYFRLPIIIAARSNRVPIIIFNAFVPCTIVNTAQIRSGRYRSADYC